MGERIPIQLQLDHGKYEALPEQLIVSDWIRVVAWSLYTIIVIYAAPDKERVFC